MELTIVTYRDLPDKSDLYHLWAQSFDFLASPRWVAEWAADEDWLQGTPIGFCGLLDGQLVGFVGVMEIPTRDRHGQVELVGGIWAVTTRPSYQRQGVGRKLLAAAEDYLRSRGHRFSFLTTSRSIVAHAWYESVGYRDLSLVDGYAQLYRILPRKSEAPRLKPKSKLAPPEQRQVVANFARAMRSRCGFVYRSQNRLPYLERMTAYDPANSEVTPLGHVLASRQFGSSRVIEIVAENKKTYRELVKSLEARTREGVYLTFVFDPAAADVLVQSRYTCDRGAYNVVMAKPLAGVAFDDVYDASFAISLCEFF